LLLVGLLVLWRVLRARKTAATDQPLDPNQRQRAEQLLKDLG
jgi:cytochrome c-type biogenesis protein CcmH/NrfF